MDTKPVCFSRRLIFILLGWYLLSVVSATNSADKFADVLVCEDVRKSVDKCQFVLDYCKEDGLQFVDYLRFYYCSSSPALAAFFIVIMVLWLGLLFMTIGIAASDYLCPNLNTISKMLGLSESLAGVTFLALGNGSPDVFSTYAAMRIGSGSLAVGELIGAASFITAVVTGSMAIVRPFKVARQSFLRDIIFFTVAVSFSMYFVSDGVLKIWECATMLAIYVIYVIFVMVWHWYNSRKRSVFLTTERPYHLYAESGQDERLIVDEEIANYQSLSVQNYYDSTLAISPVTNSSSQLLLSPNINPPARTSTPVTPISLTPEWNEQSEEQQEEAYGELNRIMRLRRIHKRNPHYDLDSQIDSPVPSSGSRSPVIPIRPSLFDALEFRDVLHQLKNPKATSAITIPQLSNHGSHPMSHSESRLSRSLTNDNSSGLSAQFSRSASFRSLPTNHDAYYSENCPILPSPSQEAYQDKSYTEPPLIIPTPSHNKPMNIPHLIITSSQDNNDTIFEPTDYTPDSPTDPRTLSERSYHDEPNDDAISLEMHSRIREFLVPPAENETFYEKWVEVAKTICPSLIGITSKSWISWVACIVTIPSICLLTLTVPVIESDAISKETDSVPASSQSSINVMPLDPSCLELKSKKSYIPIVRWLLIIQLIIGPFFVAWDLFGSRSDISTFFIYPFAISTLCIVLLYWLPIEKERAPVYMQGLAFAGFVIAIIWVSLIANEVVGILKALGIIFHISDAVLGLTVFAIGNSLGDLIANTTVAKMGFPMMALSACFGGPMLNILVGIGISGLIVLSSPHPASAAGVVAGYHIDLSHTLIISGATLLLTLLFLLISVPLNDWKFTRPLGITTIFFWVTATSINVILEVFKFS